MVARVLYSESMNFTMLSSKGLESCHPKAVVGFDSRIMVNFCPFSTSICVSETRYSGAASSKSN